jgi:hypothetical protein
MKKRVVVIGSGLCGSVLSALLRNHFQVTVIEQGKKRRPLYDDINCPTGDINSSINRAEGLGGTTNYWHNALIELSHTDLQNAGINSVSFEKYYTKAWSLFLSDSEKHACDEIRDVNCSRSAGRSFSIAHMVVPYGRINAWTHAEARLPGDTIEVVYGKAGKIVPQEGAEAAHVVVDGPSGLRRVEADYIVVCAGGLSTPVLLARSLGEEGGFCRGYHDHPMAYVAKVRLRPDSLLKSISCTSRRSLDVRSGFVYETGNVTSVFYLRPAVDLGLGSITGGARYILSDLRNDPFSLKKILQLLTNLDAVKEAVLFKTKAGFRGDYYSVLMLGEQISIDSRGIQLRGQDKVPSLNWHVSPDENLAYQRNFEKFMKDASADVVESKVVPPDQWEYRTAAHHSGTASAFLTSSDDMSMSNFAVNGLPNTFVCDASLLRAGGIANSGLTLVALAYQLSESMITGL